MLNKEILEYWTRCKLLNQPCILDKYFEIEVIDNIICLKNLDFFSYFEDYPNGNFIKLPDCITKILPHAIQTDNYVNKYCVTLDINNVTYICSIAFNVCMHIISVVGDSVEYMEKNALVLYAYDMGVNISLSFAKMHFSDIKYLHISLSDTNIHIKCKDEDKVIICK